MSALDPLTSQWPSERARFLFKEINDRGHDLPLASVTRDGGVEFRADLSISVWNPGDDISNYKRVLPGDFVIGLRSFQSGLGCSPIEGLVSPAYSVLRPRRSDMHTGYFRHLFKSDIFISRLESIAQGIRQGRTVAADDFYQLRLPLPSFTTQSAIAGYLDRETAWIDALVAAKGRMVELLDARFASALDHIFWESGAPRMALRQVASFVDYRGATPTKEDHGVPLVTASHVRDGSIDMTVAPQYIGEQTYVEWMRRGFPSRCDVIMTTEAPLGQVAQIDDPGVALAQRLILFKVFPMRILPDFLAFALRSLHFQAQLEANATGSTALGIKADRLKALRVPTPDLTQQVELVAHMRYLDQVRVRAGTALSRQIALLQEHRRDHHHHAAEVPVRAGQDRHTPIPQLRHRHRRGAFLPVR